METKQQEFLLLNHLVDTRKEKMTHIYNTNDIVSDCKIYILLLR